METLLDHEELEEEVEEVLVLWLLKEQVILV